jgi:hypothetical protein
MDELITELVRALHAVNQHTPHVATALLTGTLPPTKQREFAQLLTNLGDLLHQHADTPSPPAPQPPVAEP